jgi:hypothetical protein
MGESGALGDADYRRLVNSESEAVSEPGGSGRAGLQTHPRSSGPSPRTCPLSDEMALGERAPGAGLQVFLERDGAGFVGELDCGNQSPGPQG